MACAPFLCNDFPPFSCLVRVHKLRVPWPTLVHRIVRLFISFFLSLPNWQLFFFLLFRDIIFQHLQFILRNKIRRDSYMSRRAFIWAALVLHKKQAPKIKSCSGCPLSRCERLLSLYSLYYSGDAKNKWLKPACPSYFFLAGTTLTEGGFWWILVITRGLLFRPRFPL